jgi:hypothetical protein
MNEVVELAACLHGCSIRHFFPTQILRDPDFFRGKDFDEGKSISLRGFRTAKRVIAYLKMGQQERENAASGVETG